MTEAKPPAIRRAEAVAAVQAKFRKAIASWDGPHCIPLARALLVELGHNPPQMPCYRSALGARRALKKMGFESVEALLDSFLPRIAPAQMRVGDLAAMPGDEDFPALVICAGRKVIGFHEEQPGLVNIEPLTFTGAWRTL